MATHRLPIGINLLPHDANGFIAPYSYENTGTTQDMMVLHLHESNDSTFKGYFLIPENYVGSPNWITQWTSETTAGNVVFQIRHRTMVTGTSKLDTSTTPSEISDKFATTASKPGAVGDLEEESKAATTTDFVAGNPVYFEFDRLASSDANDTKADVVNIPALYFEYDDA